MNNPKLVSSLTLITLAISSSIFLNSCTSSKGVLETENKELKQRVEILEGLLQETPGKPQPAQIPPADDHDLEAKVEELRAEIDKLRRENIQQEPQPNPTPTPESNVVYVRGQKYNNSFRECRANDKLIDAFRAGIENFLQTRVPSSYGTDNYSNYSGQARNCFAKGHIAGFLSDGIRRFD